ncbi:hypothetical protein JCM11641_000495 [Rhodosporidiobolus odoratus]
MGGHGSTAPPFLAVTSRPALLSILRTLADREGQRRALASDDRLELPVGAIQIGQGGRGGLEAGSGRGGQIGEREAEDWFSMSVGTTRANMSKNRYGDIVAYDRTRCIPPLRSAASPHEVSYVNASLVREPDLGLKESQLRRRWWIAAQAPIPSTIHDFLSLLLYPPTSLAYWSLSATSDQTPSPVPPSLPMINLIVQLTPLVEGRREKCHPYFPSEAGQTSDVPSPSQEPGQGVWVKLEKKEEKDGARTSELTVGKEGETQGHKVIHVEYLGWRDHGVPESPAHLIRFIDRVHDLNASLAPIPPSPAVPEPPILLHCSAGVGRTGTFIAISSLLPFLSLLRTAPTLLSSLPGPPSPTFHPLGPYPTTRLLPDGVPDYVGATIDALRDQRTTMAQTQEQTLWVYQALIAAWEGGLLAK